MRCRIRGMTYFEGRRGVDSLGRLCTDGLDPFYNLANAIICVAAEDYAIALKSNNSLLKSDLEEFFMSDYYEVLTNLDPKMLMADIAKSQKAQIATA